MQPRDEKGRFTKVTGTAISQPKPKNKEEIMAIKITVKSIGRDTKVVELNQPASVKEVMTEIGETSEFKTFTWADNIVTPFTLLETSGSLIVEPNTKGA